MNSTKENELIKKALGRTPTGRERQDITTSVASNGDFIVADRGTVIGKLKAGTFENNSFQNGVAKAEQEIMNKASQVCVKIGNAKPTTKKALDKWLSENKKRKIISQDLKSNGTIVIVEDERGGRSEFSIAWR